MALATGLGDKVVLISGGASGLGAAAARAFVEQGARVAIADIQTDKATALAASLGSSVLAVRLDVTDEGQWAEAVATAVGRFGPLTTVVNSAGVSIPADIEAETLDGFRRTLAINLEGTFLGCKAAVAALRGGAGGAIVNVASTLGARGGGDLPRLWRLEGRCASVDPIGRAALRGPGL